MREGPKLCQELPKTCRSSAHQLKHAADQPSSPAPAFSSSQKHHRPLSCGAAHSQLSPSQPGECPAHFHPLPPQQPQGQPGHPRQAPKGALTFASATELQCELHFEPMTYTSNKKKAQGSWIWAGGSKGCWQALGQEVTSLSHCRRTVQDECWPAGQQDTSLFSGEGQLAAGTSSTAELNFSNTSLV